MVVALLVGLTSTLVLVVVPAPAATAAEPQYSNTPIPSWRAEGVGYASLVVGNTLYVGGSFSTVRSPDGSTSVARSNLAAFDVRTGALITSFTANTNGTVRALASDGTNLYVGGTFTSLNGVGRSRLAAVDLATGSIRTGWVANANSTVYALATAPGRLYAVGSFGTVRGVSRTRAAALNLTDGTPYSFNPRPDRTVLAVAAAPDGSAVYLGGDFARVAGTSRRYIAKVNSGGGLVSVGWQSVAGSVLDLDVSADGRRVVAALGGDGNILTGTNEGATFDAVTGRRYWGQRCDGDAQAIHVVGSFVYSGFHEGCRGDTRIRVTKNSLATGTRDMSFGPSFDLFWGARDITHSSGALVVAGDFNWVSGVRARGFVIFPDATADLTPPTAPTSLSSTTVATDSVGLRWNAATDNRGVTGYRLVRNGTVLPGTITGLSTTDTGLSPGTRYNYTVRAVDAAGNLSADSNQVAVTTTADGGPTQDTTPPTAPTSLASASVTSESVGLTWGAATDDRGVTGYRLVRNGTVLPGTITGLSTTDTGLSPATSYAYTVRAVDAAGNVSPDSNQVTVTTAAAQDTTGLYSYDWSGADAAPWPGQWTTSQSNGVADHRVGAGRLGFSDVSGAYTRAQLSGLAARGDMDVTFTYQWGKTGAGAWLDIALRGSGGWANGYRPRTGYYLEASGSSGTVYLNKIVNGSVSALRSVSGAQSVSTARQRLRFRVSGSTVQFRIWPDGTPEPSTWAATVTDTSITTDGQLHMALARSSANVGARDVFVDDLKVTAP
jgi:chitodextrinase